MAHKTSPYSKEEMDKIKLECYQLKTAGATLKQLSEHIKSKYQLERDTSAICLWMKEVANKRVLEEGIQNVSIQQINRMDELNQVYNIAIRDLARGYIESEVPLESDPSVKKKKFKMLSGLEKAKFIDSIANLIDKKMDVSGIKTAEAKTLILNQLQLNAGFDDSFFQKHGGFSQESKRLFHLLDEKVRELQGLPPSDDRKSQSFDTGEE